MQACGETERNRIRQLICDLFPKDLEEEALRLNARILRAQREGDAEGARAATLELVGLVLSNREVLEDPNGSEPPTTAQAYAELISRLLKRVQLTPPPARRLELAGQAGILEVVTPDGGTFLARNGDAGLAFERGSAPEDLLLVGVPLPDGADPLDTRFCQYPRFFDLSTVPAVEKHDPAVTAGICAVAPREVIGGLEMGHDGRSGFEILPRAELPFALDCRSDAPEGAATPAAEEQSAAHAPGPGPDKRAGGPARLADRRGIGGTVSSFSEFGFVDASCVAPD